MAHGAVGDRVGDQLRSSQHRQAPPPGGMDPARAAQVGDDARQQEQGREQHGGAPPGPGDHQRHGQQPAEARPGQRHHRPEHQPPVPVRPPPHRDRRDGQPGKARYAQAVAQQELVLVEEEGAAGLPHRENRHRAAQHDHRRDPADRQPAQPPVQPHRSRRDQPGLHQVKHDPAEEDERMDMEQPRRPEARPPEKDAGGKARDQHQRHQAGRDEEEPVLPIHRRQTRPRLRRHHTPRNVAGGEITMRGGRGSIRDADAI